MRYRLACGIEIRTENAAKPESQQSKYLLDLLSKLEPTSTAFDYGCGKLRYQMAMAEKADALALVDSEVQLSRLQTLRGKKVSIRHMFARSNSIDVYNDREFRDLNERFDRGYCINVLSVIPSLVHRKRVLQTIRNHLKRGGECLFVVQYRNSDFKRMSKMKNAVPWLDGYLINSLRGHSFYGMIEPSRLERILRRAGFAIRETKLNEGSAYTWATI